MLVIPKPKPIRSRPRQRLIGPMEILKIMAPAIRKRSASKIAGFLPTFSDIMPARRAPTVPARIA